MDDIATGMTDPAALAALAGVEFCKMTGTGNDFILIDNRRARLAPALTPTLAKALCCRRRSVGADGLIVLSPSQRVDAALGKIDFRWDFFNADGSSAEMCGNGGRCAARFAVGIGLAGPELVFDTLAGPIRAWVGRQTVTLELTPPTGWYDDLRLEIGGRTTTIHGVNTGVPHAVVPVDDLSSADVKNWGREIRFHRHFAPAGTNVNFIAARHGRLEVRTYERGVEDETLACGTGAVASALMAGRLGWLKSPITVAVRSGEKLTIHFSQDESGVRQVRLEGAADHVYDGVLGAGAFAWLANQ